MIDNYLLSATDRAGNSSEISIVIEEKTEYINWSYKIDDVNKVITLKHYIGSEINVTVRSNYKINNITYKTKIEDPISYEKLFSACRKIEAITFTDDIDMSGLTNMSEMFMYCTALKNINWGNNFDTSKVNNMSGMFGMCNSLTNLDLTSFDTSKVNNMSGMFSNCHTLTSIDLSSFDTSNVSSMENMFYNSGSLNIIYVSNNKWVIEQADTSNMFADCGTSSVTYV